jgi:hypothetical protein
MTSSAITGNTSGIATATTPGLYKAGQAPGSTSGSPVAAGFVGEKITWATAPATASSSASMATPSDWTNATFTLGAGVWEIKANIVVEISTGATVNASTGCTVSITDGSGTLVQNQSKTAGLKTPAAGVNNAKICLSFAFVENLNSSKTYKVRYRQGDATATGAINVFNQADFYSEFFAVRIA